MIRRCATSRVVGFLPSLARVVLPGPGGVPPQHCLTSEPYHVGGPSASPVLAIASPTFAGEVYYVPRPPRAAGLAVCSRGGLRSSPVVLWSVVFCGAAPFLMSVDPVRAVMVVNRKMIDREKKSQRAGAET